jgi:DNA-binding ferritin-like protein (Dps family)
MGEVGVVPVPDKKTQKKLKKTLRDKNPTIFDLLIPSRRNLFKRSLLIPGAKDSITKQRLAYEKYLREKGIDPSEELMDTDDLFRFFDKEAFRNKGQTDYMGQDVMSYGDFLLKEFGNPTVKYRGDIGAYNREMGFERGDNAPVQIANKIITDPTEPTDPNQTTDVFAGIPARFSGSIWRTNRCYGRWDHGPWNS